VLGKVLESLYLKVFITIVKKHQSMLVYIELYSKKGVIESVEEEFETIEFSADIVTFIDHYKQETPYYYIAFLDDTALQGALPTCNKSHFSRYLDPIGISDRCYHDKWSYYTQESTLLELQKRFAPVGVDFLFSPFVVLANFFKDKITKQIALFVLIEEDYLSLAVFRESQLLFAEHLELQRGDDAEDILLNDDLEEDLDLVSDEEDVGIDLDDIDVESPQESLEELGDIEDLDTLEEIEEFSENKDLEEELLESDEELHEGNEGEFNEDYQRFSLIQTAVAHYYKDDHYESEFIENIYMADTIGVSNDLKRYLEEEMFLNVYIRQADLTVEVCDLIKEELGYEV
jgi:hypothetical protein